MRVVHFGWAIENKIDLEEKIGVEHHLYRSAIAEDNWHMRIFLSKDNG